MKAFKYALLGLLLLVVIAAGVVWYLIHAFDPRNHHQQIVDAVKEHTGRTLTIDGDIGLSFWPDLAIDVGKLTLSERDSADAFAEIESARMSVQLRPLIDRQLVANELVLRGARVAIVRFEDGRLNVDDLLRRDDDKAPMAFDIARVVVERSALSFRDLAAGTQYEIGSIELTTGRLTDGVTTPVKLAFAFHNVPETMRLAVGAQGRGSFVRARRVYRFDEGTLDVSGNVAELTGIAARAQVQAHFDEAGADIHLAALGVTARTNIGQEAIAASAGAKALAWAAGRTTGTDVSMTFAARGAAGTTDVALRSPTIEFAGGVLQSNAVAAKVAMRRGDQQIRSDLGSSLRFDTAARHVSLPALKGTMSMAGPSVPGKRLRADVAGSATVDLAREAVRLALAGKVDASQVKLQVTTAGFASPVYTFSVDVDRLDLDRYATGKPAARKAEGDLLDLSPLANLPASGAVRIGELKSADIRARNVTLVLK
jgi:AsmA protein